MECPVACTEYQEALMECQEPKSIFLLVGSAVFLEIYHLAVSKRDLKSPGTFVRNCECDLGFAGIHFLGRLPPKGN